MEARQPSVYTSPASICVITPKHFMEKPDMAKLFRQVVPANFVGQALRVSHVGRCIPGARDADPFVAGELVDARQQ